MADTTIFTSETPVGHNFYEAAPITLATTFYSKVDTILDASRWWSALTYRIGTYDLVVFEATAEDVPLGNGEGIVVASVRASDSVHNFPDDQWTQWFSFAAPVRIRGYQAYKIGLRTSPGAYTASGDFFDTHTITNGDIVSPAAGTFLTNGLPSSGGTFYNGSYTPDITNYPDQTFNETAYFVDARFPDLAGALTLVGLQKQTATSGTGTLSIKVTPDAGDIVVVKLQTWDYSISMSLTDDASDQLTFTRQIGNATSGFYPWVGIDTAVCSARPSAPITISSTPTAGSRHNMTVEVWRNGTLGSAVTAQVGGAALTTSMSATAGSQISWVAADSQSRNPANSTYVSGTSQEFVDDGSGGANGVTYFATHPVGSSGSTTFGVASNTGGNFSAKIAGIEILQATGGGTTPVGSTLSTPWNIRGAVGRSLDTPWAVRASVGRTLDTPWAQRASVGRTLDSPWNIRGAVGRTLDLPWAIRSQISRTLGTPWIIRAKVTSTLQMLWVVEGAPESPNALPSVGRAELTGHVTAYPSEVTAYL